MTYQPAATRFVSIVIMGRNGPDVVRGGCWPLGRGVWLTSRRPRVSLGEEILSRTDSGYEGLWAFLFSGSYLLEVPLWVLKVWITNRMPRVSLV